MLNIAPLFTLSSYLNDKMRTIGSLLYVYHTGMLRLQIDNSSVGLPYNASCWQSGQTGRKVNQARSQYANHIITAIPSVTVLCDVAYKFPCVHGDVALLNYWLLGNSQTNSCCIIGGQI